MGAIANEFQLNLDTLKQCREQIGLKQEQVKRKVGFIEAIESGERLPTYKQLDKLADLYQVPRWVFIADELPQEYKYTHKAAFRKFRGSVIFEDSKVRKLITRVEQYRDLFIELRQDLDDPIEDFTPPDLGNTNDIRKVASVVRQWLSVEPPFDLTSFKECLEQKSIFVFFTSKYNGWSHITESFRGLAMTHETMPMIIINDSDSKQAQLFTLAHELGHLLRGDTEIDGEGSSDSDSERWCDQFAGEMLMPASSGIWESFAGNTLEDIKKLAKEFKVSPFACLVRLRQLGKINQSIYSAREKKLIEEYRVAKLRMKEKMKEKKSGMPRNRSKEVYRQFSHAFVHTVLTTWHNQEMTLHKVAKLFDLKRSQQVLDLEK